MGTQHYLPTSLPEPEILAPQPEPVREYDDALEQAAKALRVSSMRIAYYGFRMRLCDGWTKFGFPPGPKGEEMYREEKGIPRSSWYKFVRIGQALHQLPLEELERIPIGNAECLLSVDPSIIHDFPWVLEARSNTPDDLAKLVTERNRAVGSMREPLSTLVFKVPTLAKQAIREMVESFQHKHDLRSLSQALELLVADRHDRKDLLAAATQALQLIGAVRLRIRVRPELQDEADWLRMAMEVLHEACEEAVQATRKRRTIVQDDAGRQGDMSP